MNQRRKRYKLPPRGLASLLIKTLPKESRRYDYGYYVDEYRKRLNHKKGSPSSANWWFTRAVYSEAWQWVPDFWKQFLIALAVAAMISA